MGTGACNTVKACDLLLHMTLPYMSDFSKRCVSGPLWFHA